MAEPFQCGFENVSQLTKCAKQLTVIVDFFFENVDMHDFFQILFPLSTLLVPTFLRVQLDNNALAFRKVYLYIKIYTVG